MMKRFSTAVFCDGAAGARMAGFALLIIVIAGLTGCGLGVAPSTSTSSLSTTGTTSSKATIRGKVFGGQSAITGASIKLYGAGTGGYGLGSSSLMTGSPVTTDSSGTFTVTNSYSCTTGQLVYIVSSGGNTGGGTNSQAVLMAILGVCPSPGGTGAFAAITPFVTINEVTTVAAVWALQQFMAPPAAGNVGAPAIGAPSTTYSNNPNSVAGVTTTSYASGQIGLTNAFSMARILADISSGTTPNTNYAYATPQSTKLYSLANVLASCINTTGGISGDSSGCGNLFADATPSGSTPAADTVQAAWYMAQNPTNNVATLYNLGTSTPPFGGLSATPNDWTIAVDFAPVVASSSKYAVSSPVGIGIDAYGNAWIGNTGGTTNGVSASITEIGADGSPITAPVTSVTASASGGATGQFTAAPSSNNYTVTTPKIVAVDLANNAWVTLNGNNAGTPTAGVVASVTPGTNATQTGGTGAGATTSTAYYVADLAWGLAIDGSDNIYVASSSSSSISQTTLMNLRSVSQMTATGANYAYTTSTSTSAGSGAYPLPGGQALLAIDANSTAGPFVWASNYSSCKVTGDGAATTPWGTTSFYPTSNLTSPPVDSELVGGFTNSTATGGSSSNACGSSSVYVGQVLSGATYTTADPSNTAGLLYATLAGTANPYGIAVDKNNGIWITDVYTSSLGFDGLTYLSAPTSAAGAVASAYTYVDGGTSGSTIAAPQAGKTMTKAGADIVDGNNNVWAVTQTGNNIVEGTLCTSTTTPSCTPSKIVMLTPGAGGLTGVGFLPTNTGNMMATPTGIAIDPSGNVWAANSSTSASGGYTSQNGSTLIPGGNAVTVLVGAAGPVVTPLSVAVANKHVGQKP